MRVVLAPDSLKGSCEATAAAAAIADGWRSQREGDELVLLPMADGGEGTIDAFAASIPAARRRAVRVLGPDSRLVDACWLRIDRQEGPTAIVELASTSGIELLGERRLPWAAHTRGFGQAIAAALEEGAHRLVLGIGSSASTDGGAGLLAELGVRLTDARGAPIADGAEGVATVAHVDATGWRRAPEGGAVVLSDVTSPLLGPRGAAAVFGPQKGLGPDDVPAAERALARLAPLLGVDPATPGAGAAGGTGLALLAWGASLESGAREVARIIGLPAAIAAADLVVTGEGAFDGQSAAGKVAHHVATLAHAASVPVALVAGRIMDDADTGAFAASAELASLAGSSSASMAEPERWLRAAGRHLATLAP